MSFDRRSIVIVACVVVIALASVVIARSLSTRIGPRFLGATAPVKLRCVPCGGQYTLESREYRHRGALLYHPRYAKGEAMPSCPLCKAVYASMLPATCPSCLKQYIFADTIAKPSTKSTEELKKFCPFENR